MVFILIVSVLGLFEVFWMSLSRELSDWVREVVHVCLGGLLLVGCGHNGVSLLLLTTLLSSLSLLGHLRLHSKVADHIQWLGNCWMNNLKLVKLVKD
mgnify:CR=1 FL=1